MVQRPSHLKLDPERGPMNTVGDLAEPVLADVIEADELSAWAKEVEAYLLQASGQS